MKSPRRRRYRRARHRQSRTPSPRQPRGAAPRGACCARAGARASGARAGGAGACSWWCARCPRGRGCGGGSREGGSATQRLARNFTTTRVVRLRRVRIEIRARARSACVCVPAGPDRHRGGSRQGCAPAGWQVRDRTRGRCASSAERSAQAVWRVIGNFATPKTASDENLGAREPTTHRVPKSS